MPKLSFDATSVEPLEAFEALPAGWYPVIVSGSDTFITRAGNEAYKLEMTVTDGPAVNRKLFVNLNIGHPNNTADEIARRELASICAAAGVAGIEETEELHNLPLEARVVVESSSEHGDRNRVKGYRPARTSEAMANAMRGAPRPALAAVTTKAAATVPPWKR
jgi:hypothetical protein